MAAALQQQLPRLDRGRRQGAPVRALEAPPAPSRDRRAGILAGALAFFCFMPYPALAIGNNSAIQLGNVVTLLLCAPALAAPWIRRGLWLYPLLMAPLALASLRVALSGEGDLSLCLKTLAVWAVSCLTMTATQLHAPGHALEFLAGIAVATLVHLAVGVLQAYSFASGVFPLVSLYVNPSFLSVQENAEIIARYAQRPFGLFPEPSAMSSSLAPWVVFWVANLCGGVRLRREPGRRMKALFAAAALAGIGLIILSRSGHAAITLAAVLPFAAAWLARHRLTARFYLVIVLVCGVLLPAVLYLAVQALSSRVGDSPMGNSSWEDRSASLWIGLSLMADGNLSGLVFGMGPGLSATAIQKTDGLEAVWSVLLPYVYETGVIGAVVVCGVGYYLLRVWQSQRFALAFAAFVVVWLVGITVTTSYNQLLPIWMALGWLTVWPDVCAPQPARRSAVRAIATFTDPTGVELGSAWRVAAPAAGVSLRKHLKQRGSSPC